MTSYCDVEHVPPNDKASSPGEMTSHCDVEHVAPNDKASSPGEMTSHCDVGHVAPNDKASSLGEMTSRRSFPLGAWTRRVPLNPGSGIYIYGKTIKLGVVKVSPEQIEIQK